MICPHLQIGLVLKYRAKSSNTTDTTIEMGLRTQDQDKERRIRGEILEMTSAWLSRVVATDQFLALLESSTLFDLLASYVTIFVYDRERHCYFVKMATGGKKIPKNLFRLDESSRLVKDLSIQLEFEKLHDTVKDELKRFGAEMCFPIFYSDQLTGILLVGPRPDGTPHNTEAIRFFHTLTNEIGVEFIKENYYLNSITDPLTGLYNRKHLSEYLTEVFPISGKPVRERVGLALLDIDHFKAINDRLGHQAGDKVLQVVAEKMKSSVRETDRCFRYGGEEFCILFRDLTRRDGSIVESKDEEYSKTIISLVSRLKKSIAETNVLWNQHEIKITTSIGVAFLSANPDLCAADRLISEADGYLYEAKRSGRNRIIFKNGEDSRGTIY